MPKVHWQDTIWDVLSSRFYQAPSCGGNTPRIEVKGGQHQVGLTSISGPGDEWNALRLLAKFLNFTLYCLVGTGGHRGGQSDCK